MTAEVDEKERDARARPGLGRLYWLGGATAAVYLAVALFYRDGPETRSRSAKEVVAWLSIFSLLTLYLLGYRAVRTSTDARVARVIVAFCAVFCIITVLTYPYHSTDVFGYINRGWQQFHYGYNPYIVRLADVPDWKNDPMLREHWLYNPNPYGPLFSLLAWGVCAIGNGNWWLTLILFKLVNVGAFAATAWIISATSRRFGRDPATPLYLFLWCPLILIHHIANGHNDLLVGLFITLALYRVARGSYTWVLPALAAGTLLKYGPILMAPFLVIWIYQQRGIKPLVIGGAISSVLGGLVLAPYLRDWRLMKLEEIRDNAVLLDNSLHSFLFHIYGTIAGLIQPLAAYKETVSWAIGLGLRGAFVVFFLLMLYRAFRDRTVGAIVVRALFVFTVLVCVVSSKFNGWYMGMLMGPALLLSERNWLGRVIVAITTAQTGSITFLKQAYIVNYFLMHLVPIAWIYRRTRTGDGVTISDIGNNEFNETG